MVPIGSSSTEKDVLLTSSVLALAPNEWPHTEARSWRSVSSVRVHVSCQCDPDVAAAAVQREWVRQRSSL
jgi:hypothetical protein